MLEAYTFYTKMLVVERK